MTEEHVVSDRMVGERRERDTYMITSCVFESPRKNARSTKQGNEVAPGEGWERGEALLIKNLLST